VSADDKLDALAGSISDGRPVDWNQEETEADADEESSVRALRDVSLIAEFSRDLQREIEETTADENAAEDRISGTPD
jgi:hypothetical protein